MREPFRQTQYLKRSFILTGRPNIRLLAQRQRWLLWLFLSSLLMSCAPYFFLPAFVGFPVATGGAGSAPTAGMALGAFAVFAIGLVQIAITVLMIVGVGMLLSAKGSHPAVIVLCVLLMIAPCVNLITLLVINSSITRTLRRAGMRVGLMGVNPNDLERALNPMLCKHCGYDLTGNTTGRCPECGFIPDVPVAGPIGPPPGAL